MKVQYFYADKIDTLQNEINEWIKGNKKILKIIDIKYSTTVRYGAILFSSIIIYKNKYSFNLKLIIKKLLKIKVK